MLAALEALAAFRQHGTLALAGTYLHLEPSTVWKRIKTLEAETDIILIRKRGRRAELTPEALTLLDEAADPLQSVRETISRLARGGKKSPRIRVGVSESLMLSWGPRLLRSAAQKLPLDLHYSSNHGPILQEKLRNGSLDLVLSAGRSRPDPLILDQKILDEKAYLCTHPDAGDFRGINHLPVLYCISRNSLSYDRLEEQMHKLLKRENFGGELRELESYAGIASLIRSGYGAGFLPQGIAELYALRWHRALFLTRPISIHFKKGVLRLPAMEQFLAQIERAASRFG